MPDGDGGIGPVGAAAGETYLLGCLAGSGLDRGLARFQGPARHGPRASGGGDVGPELKDDISDRVFRLGIISTDEENTRSSAKTKVACLALLAVDHLIPGGLGLRPLIGLALVRVF